MPQLNPREKRLLSFAIVGISIYLALFGGLKLWRQLEARRGKYEQMITDANRISHQIRPYENRVLLAEKLKETYRLNPQKLSRTTVVAEASAAIQKEAKDRKVGFGPIRETAIRRGSTSKELASIQVEGSGPVTGVLELLQRLPALGYPIIIDSVQITPENKPGNVKVSLTLVILDYDNWKTQEAPRA
jgi:hypothetical protein